jgi:hypothetical protein
MLYLIQEEWYWEGFKAACTAMFGQVGRMKIEKDEKQRH